MVTTKKAKDLKDGDKVDMENSILPFTFNDPLAEFEYGIVESIEEETPDCFLVIFENMDAIGIGPDCELLVDTE